MATGAKSDGLPSGSWTIRKSCGVIIMQVQRPESRSLHSMSELMTRSLHGSVPDMQHVRMTYIQPSSTFLVFDGPRWGVWCWFLLKRAGYFVIGLKTKAFWRHPHRNRQMAGCPVAYSSCDIKIIIPSAECQWILVQGKAQVASPVLLSAGYEAGPRSRRCLTGVASQQKDQVQVMSKCADSRGQLPPLACC